MVGRSSTLRKQLRYIGVVVAVETISTNGVVEDVSNRDKWGRGCFGSNRDKPGLWTLRKKS